MQQPIEHSVQQVQSAATKFVKNRIYDVIAAIIVVAVIALSLGVIERRVIQLSELIDIIVECIPLFFAGMLLNSNFYNKGVYYGKQTHLFKTASTSYSQIVSQLTGEQIRMIPDFCIEYNDTVLKTMQSNILKTEGLTYEQFTQRWEDGKIDRKPLKAMCENELKSALNDDQIKVVKKAKRVKIKGLLVNVLLGTNCTEDTTDVGYTEEQLKRRKMWTSVLVYFASTLILALIGVKNVQEWGWFGIALVIFKVIYIFCKSYMSYFDGYNDVTIHLVNSTNRKTDILKECQAWINSKETSERYSLIEGNNLDKIDIE